MNKKIMGIILAVLFAVACAKKADAKIIQIQDVVSETRIAEIVTTTGETFTGLYIPVLVLNHWGADLFSVNIGTMFENENQKGHPLLAAGVRFDALLHILNIPNANLFEVGGVYSHNFISKYDTLGFYIGKKFGGK